MTKTKTTIIASMAILVTGILMGVQASESLNQTEAYASEGDIYTISTEITVNEVIEKNVVSCDAGDILLTGGYAADNSDDRIYASSLPVFDGNGDAKGWKVKTITIVGSPSGVMDIVINCKDVSEPFR